MKQRKQYRLLAMLLAFVLCIGLLPTPVWAQALEDGNLPVQENSFSADAEKEDVSRTNTGNGTWHVQQFGAVGDLDIPEGGLIAEPDGDGFTLNHKKFTDAGLTSSLLVYNDAAPELATSVLEFDINCVEVSNRYRIAIFPRFQASNNCGGIAIDSPNVFQAAGQNGGEYWTPTLSNSTGFSFASGTEYHIKVVTGDSSMELYVDGTLITSRDLTRMPASGGYAFRIWGVDFGDVEKTVSIKNIQFYDPTVPPVGEDAGNFRYQPWQGTEETEFASDVLSTVGEHGFTLSYQKHCEAIGTGEYPAFFVYDRTAPSYTYSVLEFDMNMHKEQNLFYRIGIFPRFQDGNNGGGISVSRGNIFESTTLTEGTPKYLSIRNTTGFTFNAGTNYHVKMLTEPDGIKLYVDGVLIAERPDISSLPDRGTYAFRIYGTKQAAEADKSLTITNIHFEELKFSTVDQQEITIDAEEWGQDDVTIPVTFDGDDAVSEIRNNESELVPDTDYTISTNGIVLKKEYISKQAAGFQLAITFAGGVTANFIVNKKLTPFIYEVDFADADGESWVKQSGSGAVMLENGALHITGETLVVDTLSPVSRDGEAEFVIETLTDNGNFGLVFRADDNDNWQSFYNSDSAKYQFATGLWNYRNNGGTNTQVLADGTPVFRRPEGVNYTMKIRFVGTALTVWMDGNPIYSADLSQMGLNAGHIGIQTGGSAEILLKRVTYRSCDAQEESENAAVKTIAKDGLTIKLASDFPRVIDYTFNAKTMGGCVTAQNVVSINGTSYPASASVKAESGTSVTYAVTVDMDGEQSAAFDVTFTACEGNVLDMQVSDIRETGCTVYTLGFPEQPLISARESDTGAALDISTGGADRHFDLASSAASKTATSYATIAIVTANGLSASLTNNVYLNFKELSYRSFDLKDGNTATGVWNTDFYYRGLDGELMLSDGELPSCQIVVTEDTNGDGIMNWQDGANALKTLVKDKIPGAEIVRNSDFHVGYNFVSEAQQPFLKIADNYKRFGNLIDGFNQILVLKGYANEGHDSGHADYADINKRAGGAEDLNILTGILEDEGLGVFGIHINHSEAYPEAEMYTDETMSTKNGWKWMDQSKYIRREVDIMNGGMDQRLDDLFAAAPGIGFVYVDTYRDERFAAAKLAQALTEKHGVILGTEEASKLDRWTAWSHDTMGGTIHRFVYHTQKDVYGGNRNFWGGYSRAQSMMSWQHNWNITPLVETFYTNQLPQKYLMHHDVLRLDGSDAYFEGDIRTNNYQMWKNGKLMVGNGGYFIPWYGEDSTTQNPDDADKIYYWNNNTGSATWDLPNETWAALDTVYLYKTTQNGRELVSTLQVVDGKVTIEAQAKTPYVLYPGEARAEQTEWSVGSPIKDTGFNSRNFSVWQKDGAAEIAFNDDSNGVSILTISGQEAGQVSQTMTGLTVGQKYRVVVWAGAASGKTARLTIKQGDSIYENYVEQTVRANNHFDTYANNKWVDRIWVDFVAAEETAEIILSADACESEAGVATFMESRILKTADPGMPTDDSTRSYAAYETFEYVEQGGPGIFTPEGGGDGGYHLSQTHLPYTSDTISENGSMWSLKMYGYGRASMRTYPSTMRLLPNTEYTMEFDALGSGSVYVISESDNSDQRLSEAVSAGHSQFVFTTGGKSDYIVCLTGIDVLDNFAVYHVTDETPPTIPGEVTVSVVDNDYVELSWTEAVDDDGRVSGYRIYRNGQFLAQVGEVTNYTDRDVSAYTGYFYQVSAVNAGGTEGEKSETVVAYVGASTVPPTVTKAELNHVTQATLTFSKEMDKTSVETVENYTLSGGASVTAAELDEDGKVVKLTLSNVENCEVYTLRIEHVKDITGIGAKDVDAIVLSQLIRYLKLDETEGAVAVDFMGNGDGTRSNTVQSAAGQNGNAAKFNSDGYIDLAGDTLDGLTEHTISMWFNWDGTANESKTLFSNNVSAVANSGGIWVRLNNGIITVDGLEGSGDALVTTQAVSRDTWHHLAIVLRTDGSDLYMDGTLVKTTAKTVRLNGNKLRIGGNYNSSNTLLHKFGGMIDEFRIYGCALTAQDVEKIKNENALPHVIGDTYSVEAGERRELCVKVDFNGSQLSQIENNGELLSEENYTVANSAVIFSAEYMSGLAIGEYTLKLTFDNVPAASNEITVKVLEKEDWVDITPLLRVIFEAKLLKQKDYPNKAEQWDALQSAIEAAEEVSKQQDLTQAQIDDEALRLQAAMDAVTVKVMHTVTADLTNLSSNAPAAVEDGTKLEVSLTAENGYKLPETIIVTMGGIELTIDEEYTYENGKLTIAVVTGDVVITIIAVPQPVDKSALTDAITAANTAKEGVVVSDKTEDEVAKDTKFVTETEMDALDTAIAAAQAIVDNADATQAEVDEAVTTLNATVNTFKAAIKTGTNENIAPPVDKSALNAAITAANTAKDGVVVSDKTEDEMARDVKFVTEDEMTALTAAIAAAQAIVDNADATQTEVDEAVTTLNAAVNTFKNAIKIGTNENVAPPVDKSALTAAITAANTAKEGVVVSDKTADEVAKDTKFVTEDEMAALTDAIAAAQAIVDNADATQTEVDEAVTTLNAAVNTFKSAIKTGAYEDTSTPVAPPAPVTPPTTTETKENEDGTTTTIVTDNRTGTVTETTEKADGTVEVVETKKDGTVTETTTDPEGGKVEKVTNPDKDVAITVTDKDGEVLAEVELPAEIPASETRFVDVPEGHWADEAIHNMAALEVVNGIGNDRYDMNGNMTRGALATVLSRLSNGQEGLDSSFADVASDAWYSDGIAWAAKTGVVTGYSETEFGPEDSIIREQLAVMLCRYARLLGIDTSADTAALNGFNDGSSTHDWAADSIAWCVANGILQGKGNATLAPTATATRAEVAVMLQRFIDLMK